MTQNSYANITSTVIDTVEVDETAAVVFSIDSTVHIEQVSISNAQANSGAAFFVSFGSELVVDKTTFSNMYSITQGGILLQTAEAWIEDSSFFNCTAG